MRIARDRITVEDAVRLGASRRTRRGFTLIELLVVIAMIAIFAAVMMPAVIATNGRTHTTTCESRLQAVGMAARMYAEDYGAYPADLQRLVAGRYLDDRELLLCVKSGAPFHYTPPRPGTAPRDILASCVGPDAPWPHEGGGARVVLLANGKTRAERR